MKALKLSNMLLKLQINRGAQSRLIKEVFGNKYFHLHEITISHLYVHCICFSFVFVDIYVCVSIISLLEV